MVLEPLGEEGRAVHSSQARRSKAALQQEPLNWKPYGRGMLLAGCLDPFTWRAILERALSSKEASSPEAWPGKRSTRARKAPQKATACANQTRVSRATCFFALFLPAPPFFGQVARKAGPSFHVSERAQGTFRPGLMRRQPLANSVTIVKGRACSRNQNAQRVRATWTARPACKRTHPLSRWRRKMKKERARLFKTSSVIPEHASHFELWRKTSNRLRCAIAPTRRAWVRQRRFPLSMCRLAVQIIVNGGALVSGCFA